MFMSVLNASFDREVPWVVAAIWRANGETDVHQRAGSAKIQTKQAWGDLVFGVSADPLDGPGVLGCKPLGLPPGGWALRLDEVAFPVGAIAHQHTHSGEGWRYLVSGALRVETEEGDTMMLAGDSWFEPAFNPVRAVALHGRGVTRFVRCMAIPTADVGRSTFRLLRREDAELPRLQVTHRHFDLVVQVDAG